MGTGIFDLIIVLLAVTVVMVALFHRVFIPPILGYLLIGVLGGPFALGWVPDTQITSEVAEFGVVFLMFTIGLEFSWARIAAMWRDVFLLGSLSVLLSLMSTMLICYALNMTITESFLIGGIIAMSSTVIISKQLIEQNELNTPHGIRSIGITLFQDLFAIPFLIMIPALAAASYPSFGWVIVVAIMKAIAVIAFIIIGGRWILRPVFSLIARTHSVELFTLTALLVTLGSAWITYKSGLSLALGAFLAGMLLGETEYRHQIDVDIRPFRDVLLGLFFVSIGMDFDLKVLFAEWPALLLLLGVLVFLKVIIITLICRIGKSTLSDAFRSALILSHGGEFGFVILSLTSDYHLLTKDDGEIILGAIFLSMVISPFLIRYNGAIAQWLIPQTPKVTHEIAIDPNDNLDHNLQHHVIICGFGRVGQNIAQLLKEFKIPYFALDLDPPQIEEALLDGDSVGFGDASQRDLLLAAGLMQADAVIVSFNDPDAACHVLSVVRELSTELPVIIRATDFTEAQFYYDLGATAVIPEVLEASLSMSMHLLMVLNKPIHEVTSVLNRMRREQYKLHKEKFPEVIPSHSNKTGS